jgi:segregation and condensation protein A
MEYQVNLDTFRGPLDLLLYLVKHDEIDIRDIPIARVAEQFLQHLRVIELIDVELAGDFLVMAATLMEIKSRMVLPRTEEPGSEDGDPRQELVRQLLEYKKFKDAATLLEVQAEKHMSRLPRVPVEAAQLDPAAQPLRAVELWDLVSAFGRLMRETMALAPQQIVIDETPINVYMESIVAQLDRQPHLPFRDLFTPPYTRGRLLGLFLAILELIKGRQVHADQPEPFGEITLSKAPEADPAASA